jgi:hypothetical protein
MPPREDENPDLSPLCGGDPLARQLAALQPLPPGLNRDQLLYAAGAAARDRDVVFWKRFCLGQAAALCTAVGVGLAANGWTDSDPPAGPVHNYAALPPIPPPAVTPGREEAPLPIPHSEFRIPNSQGFAAAEADALPPGELAKLLRLRADIFAAGLGVLPTPDAPPPRADATALEKSLHLPPGVLASPYAPPKPKPPEPKEQE